MGNDSNMAMTDNRAREAFGAALERVGSIHTLQVLKLAFIRMAWLAILAALVLVFGDLFLALGDGLRFKLDIVYVVLIPAVGMYTLWREQRSRSHDRMLIRMIEERHPELHNALINATDFTEALAKGGPTGLTADLMDRAISEGQAEFDALPYARALRPPSLKKELRLLLGLMGLAVVLLICAFGVFSAVLPRYLMPYADFPPYSATRFKVEPGAVTVDYGSNQKISVKTFGEIPESASLVLRTPDGIETASFSMFALGKGRFFQTLENVRDDVDYFVRADRGRSRRYRLTIEKLPRITETKVTYRYPDYTYRKPRTRLVAGQPLEGYVNTEVTLTVASNRPLAGGRIEVCGKPYEFTPTKDDRVEVTFPLLEDGDYSGHVIDVDGNASAEKVEGKIALVPDEKPAVSFVSPGMDSFALPDSEVPLIVEAQDDLGISRIELYRNHNDSSDMRKSLYLGEGEESIVEVMEVLDLKDLGLRPGDSIDYYATASDSRPGAPQSAATAAFTLQIISFEEYRDFMQTQTTATELAESYNSLLEELEAIAEAQEDLAKETRALQEGLDDSSELSDEKREELEQAQARQRELAEIANELAEHMNKKAESPAIFDIEEDYKKALKDMAERLAKASEKMDQADGEMGKACEKGGSESSGKPSSCMKRAGELQKEALDALKKNVADFKEGIQKPNENLEKVSAVLADLEMFKYLYTLQEGLERQIRYYKDMSSPSLDDTIRLKELSEEQSTVNEALTELKASLRLHADGLDELAQEESNSSEVE